MTTETLNLRGRKVTAMKSEDIRQSWRKVLDDVRFRDTDVVIERYNEPVGVIVNYDRYRELVKLEKTREDNEE